MKRAPIASEAIARILLSNKLCRVDRTAWLSKKLSVHILPEDMPTIARLRPEDFVSPQVIDQIATLVVESHIRYSTALAGGFTLFARQNLFLATLGDSTAFWVDLMILTQKLAYLYGWDDFYTEGKATNETVARLCVMLGYGLGVHDCQRILLGVATDDSPCINAELRSLGVSITQQEKTSAISQEAAYVSKSILAGVAAKRAPLWGVAIGGLYSYFSYRRIARRIQRILQEVMYTRIEEEGIYEE